MAETNTAVIEPIAQHQQPDQTQQPPAPGVQTAPTQRKKSVIVEQASPERAELAALRAKVAQLEATQQRAAGPDMLTPDQLREAYSLDSSFTDEVDPLRILSASRHIAKREYQEALAQQRQEFARMSYMAAVSANVGDPVQMYESNLFATYARENPDMDAAFRRSYETMDAATTVAVARDFEAWKEEKAMSQQRQQYQQPQYPQQQFQQPQYPQPQWEHPPVQDIVYPPTVEQMMQGQQAMQQQQPNMAAQMMPRNAAAPPQRDPDGPIYSMADIEAFEDSYIRTPRTQRSPQMTAQYTEYQRAKALGRVR